MMGVPSLTAGFKVFVVVATSRTFVTADLSIVSSMSVAFLLMRMADWLFAWTVSLIPGGCPEQIGGYCNRIVGCLDKLFITLM